METRTAVVRCVAQHLHGWGSAGSLLARYSRAVLDGRLGADLLRSGDALLTELAVGSEPLQPALDGALVEPDGSEAQRLDLDHYAAATALRELAAGRLGDIEPVEGLWCIEAHCLDEHGISYNDIRAVASGQGYPVAAAVILEALTLND